MVRSSVHAAASLALFITCAASHAEIEFESCSLNGSGGTGRLHAECGRWLQPLNREDADGEQVELFVARLPTTALEPAGDAVTLINGGPGGSSVDLLVDFAGVVEAFTRERDVVVLDQRGTGRSAPMRCHELNADTPESLDADTVVDLTRTCLDQLPHDPRFFTTTVATEDLEALRSELGYKQWDIYGVSYGTRVAQQYMRAYPEQTRSVILDGVVPAPRVLGANIAVHSQQALDQVFARCAGDTLCNAQFPRFKSDFHDLAERLSAAPLALELQHPVTGQLTSLELSYGYLALWLRFALYAPETTALIPLITHQAARQANYLPIAANALRSLHDVSSMLNYGMHNAVVCTEDTPFYGEQKINDAELDETYLGREMYETLRAMCSAWPAGVMHPDMKRPVKSAVPTLVLSGEYDPITPPAWGDEIMPGLSNARHIVVPGQGHGTLVRGCIGQLARQFIESANAAALDAECTDHMAAYPFFLDMMGPPP
jgi:pimeloyl-ACP methyl ester carboxylesterase